MTDVSKTIPELIAEARTAAPGDDPTELAVKVHRLADALEAAARVPVQGEPNDDRAEIFYCPIHGDLLDPRMSRSYRCLDAPEGHEYVTSRTTVPDAATEERVKKIILESLVFINENSDPWAQLLTENILAALDGAPEPEWEYGCRSSAHWETVNLDPGLDDPEDHGYDCPSPAIVRRRKAGPWEQIKGESDE